MRSKADAAQPERAMTFTERARRQQIAEAAMSVIVASGYANASIAKIADHIGVAKSVVLYHFKTKNDIIEAVVGAVFAGFAAHLEPALAAADSAQGRLAAYIRANAAYIHANRVAATALLEIVTGFRSPDGLRLDQVADSTSAGSTVFDPEPIFADGMRSGEFRDLSPVFMKNALRAALDGAVWELARNPDYDVVGYGEELVAVFDLATRAR